MDSQSRDAYPVSTIQCNGDSIVAISTDFHESIDNILFNDRQLFAACVDVNKC
jgi:hypothetical protein